MSFLTLNDFFKFLKFFKIVITKNILSVLKWLKQIIKYEIHKYNIFLFSFVENEIYNLFNLLKIRKSYLCKNKYLSAHVAGMR